ncbi:MAG: chorismate mutase [Oscillospiraceae bacterium]|nr:chorismate mutase [Oscillospiraceae bacterium]
MKLERIREEIDEIDNKILLLFKERLEKTDEVARYKQKNNLPILNVEREKQIIDRICGECNEHTKDYAARLFDTLFDISRDYQKVILTNKE